MSSSFRKFIYFVVSLIFSWITLYIFLMVYSNAVAGNSFGGEVIFIGPPIFLISLFFFYALLKKMFGINVNPNINSQSQTKVVAFSLLFIGLVILSYFGFKSWEHSKNIQAQQYMQDSKIKREIFLREHCVLMDKSSKTPVFKCDDGSYR